MYQNKHRVLSFNQQARTHNPSPNFIAIMVLMWSKHNFMILKGVQLQLLYVRLK